MVVKSAYTAVRSGPSRDYNRITVLQEGVPMWAETKSGEWYRVRLHQALAGWVHEDRVRPLSKEEPRPRANVTDISIRPWERGARVSIQLSGAIPFRVRQILRPAQLKIDLFGASLARYGVRHLPTEPFVLSVTPEQMLTDWVEVTIDLDMGRHTGYDAYYANSRRLNIDIRRPITDGNLRGKVVALDAGHGGKDCGAVGPTGLQEKDVNLRIALLLRERLLASGATVVMTRETDTSLMPAGATLLEELTARAVATKNTWPDIFVSIHNNDPGSGDRSKVFGTETYYWTPMSIAPARRIHEAVCAALGTQSRFVSWRPFCVLRETDTPRVLVECGYISNPNEEACLRDEGFLRAAAEGILQGVAEYFEDAARAQAERAPWRGGLRRSD